MVRFDLVAMGQVTRLKVSHFGLEPDGPLLKAIAPGWPMILSSLKSLMETGEPLTFRADGSLRVRCWDVHEQRRRKDGPVVIAISGGAAAIQNASP